MAEIVKKLYEQEKGLFTINSLKSLLEVENQSTFYRLLRTFIDNQILIRLEKGKYRLKDSSVHEFRLANFLYQPSYISFESALNYYGLLSQFPLQIYSASAKKAKEKQAGNKVFVYHQLDKDLYAGYEKRNSFIIACPEKALVDQLYFVSKGIKSVDLEELDLSLIDIQVFNYWADLFPKNSKFNNLIERVNNA